MLRRILALSEPAGAGVRSPIMGRVTYEVWKELLQIDCVQLDKLGAFNSLGEGVLRILYENGVDPTVEAVVRDGINGKHGRPRF